VYVRLCTYVCVRTSVYVRLCTYVCVRTSVYVRLCTYDSFSPGVSPRAAGRACPCVLDLVLEVPQGVHTGSTHRVPPMGRLHRESRRESHWGQPGAPARPSLVLDLVLESPREYTPGVHTGCLPLGGYTGSLAGSLTGGSRARLRAPLLTLTLCL
jgi:hypothetical protein